MGNFGVAPNDERLRREGFLDGGQNESASPVGHDYYRMKNWLAPEVEEALLSAGERANVRMYRFTGTLYEREFGRMVARNRNNRWRRELGAWERIETSKLDSFLRWLGFHPISIRETGEGYRVELPDGETATEDIAMTVGAEFKTSVIYNNHRIAPTMADLRFYGANSLFALAPGWESVANAA